MRVISVLEGQELFEHDANATVSLICMVDKVVLLSLLSFFLYSMEVTLQKQDLCSFHG